jgi:hypothetical protein
MGQNGFKPVAALRKIVPSGQATALLRTIAPVEITRISPPILMGRIDFLTPERLSVALAREQWRNSIFLYDD